MGWGSKRTGPLRPAPGMYACMRALPRCGALAHSSTCTSFPPRRPGPTQAIKLPKQTRVTQDEYRAFLSLGHGEIFELDLDK